MATVVGIADSCVFSLGHLANHEPPIGFGGGSFFVDKPSEIADSSFNSMTSVMIGTTQYQKYSFVKQSGRDYTGIDRIAVLTERNSLDDSLDGGLCFVIYEFPSGANNIKLRLWLSGIKKPTSFPSLPDVIVEGNSRGAIYTLQPFNSTTNLSKIQRTRRYNHPGDTTLSVVKWDAVEWTNILDPGTVSNVALQSAACEMSAGGACGAVSDDMYYFYVSFNHS